MTSAFKAYLYAMEATAFVVLCGLFFFALTQYEKTESFISREISNKNDVGNSFEDYEDENLTNISGAAVITEIMEFDDSITVKINSTTVNNITNPYGISFFEYLKEYGTKQLLGEVSITSMYRREYTYDKTGNLATVQYTIVM